jgi:hypothetical protein
MQWRPPQLHILVRLRVSNIHDAWACRPGGDATSSGADAGHFQKFCGRFLHSVERRRRSGRRASPPVTAKGRPICYGGQRDLSDRRDVCLPQPSAPAPTILKMLCRYPSTQPTLHSSCYLLSRKPCWLPSLSTYCPTMSPCGLISFVSVETAPGTSMVVKLPLLSTKP